MRSYSGAMLVLAVAVALGVSLAPGRTRAAIDRTEIFALSRSLYPVHVHLWGHVPANHDVDHLIGTMHLSSFGELGRHPDHGWLQAAVWEPSFDVVRPDGSRRRHTALLTTAYVVSEYDSPADAHAAVQDIHIPGQTWRHLAEGADGQILYQKQVGYSIIAAAFSQGIYDVEDLTLVAPHTPRAFHRTIKTSVLNQLVALQQISAGLDTNSG